jgi:hypothetical protein
VESADGRRLSGLTSSAAEDVFVAPFQILYCLHCCGSTRHRYALGAVPADYSRVYCEGCKSCVEFGPGDDEYLVTVASTAARTAGADEYDLRMVLVGGSARAALDVGLRHARSLNSRAGMPPHGIRVCDDELVRQATVAPVWPAEPVGTPERDEK